MQQISDSLVGLVVISIPWNLKKITGNGMKEIDKPYYGIFLLFLKKIKAIFASSFLSKVKELYRFMRIQKPVTGIVGRLFQIDHFQIEIDITYRCHLKCFNCDRSCDQAPSDECMTLGQIKKFVDESIEQKRKWRKIRILGGEPSLHSRVFDIIQQILFYKKTFSPDTTIQFVTNGFGTIVRNVLSKIPTEVMIINTAKLSPVQRFEPVHMAPQDCIMYKYADYLNGCWVNNECGLGLTRYGYYPCATGGSIDRVFGFNIGRKSLPKINDLMLEELRILCKYCGRFKSCVKKYLITEEKMSSSWKLAYENYKRKKPYLSFY